VSIVLVTGADGFTGRYLCQALAEIGHEVHAIVRRRSDIPIIGVYKVHEVDIRDLNELQRCVSLIQPESVIHLAAIAFVGSSNADEMYTVNVLGTRNLLMSLSSNRCAPSRVLLVSSGNVYGNCLTDIINEDVMPAPVNDYAVSKVSMELMANLWTESLPITVVRPFNYIGRGQSSKFVVAKIIDHVLMRKPTLELGNINIVRDFSDVRMIVDTYKRIISTPSMPFGPFNVSSGNGSSVQDLIEYITDICGYFPKVEINRSLIRSNDIMRLVGSSSRLEEFIGPLNRVPLKETLLWMVNSKL
jgi:nucleoside-diphosphate-sugar epimerase